MAARFRRRMPHNSLLPGLVMSLMRGTCPATMLQMEVGLTSAGAGFFALASVAPPGAKELMQRIDASALVLVLASPHDDFAHRGASSITSTRPCCPLCKWPIGSLEPGGKLNRSGWNTVRPLTALAPGTRGLFLKRYSLCSISARFANRIERRTRGPHCGRPQ